MVSRQARSTRRVRAGPASPHAAEKHRFREVEGSRTVNPRERELLTGMGNCYEACHADFEGTIEMVAGNRHRTPEDVIETLLGMGQRYAEDPEYRHLRARLPSNFPF